MDASEPLLIGFGFQSHTEQQACGNGSRGEWPEGKTFAARYAVPNVRISPRSASKNNSLHISEPAWPKSCFRILCGTLSSLFGTVHRRRLGTAHEPTGTHPATRSLRLSGEIVKAGGYSAAPIPALCGDFFAGGTDTLVERLFAY